MSSLNPQPQKKRWGRGGDGAQARGALGGESYKWPNLGWGEWSNALWQKKKKTCSRARSPFGGDFIFEDPPKAKSSGLKSYDFN